MASRKVLYKIKEAHKLDSQLAIGFRTPEPILDKESKQIKLKDAIIQKMEDTCKEKD